MSALSIAPQTRDQKGIELDGKSNLGWGQGQGFLQAACVLQIPISRTSRDRTTMRQVAESLGMVESLQQRSRQVETLGSLVQAGSRHTPYKYNYIWLKSRGPGVSSLIPHSPLKLETSVCVGGVKLRLYGLQLRERSLNSRLERL